MPEIVKYCCKSIKRHAVGYEVIFLTSDNYNEYAKLPQHIIKRFDTGDISIAHLSDIIRVFLISQYGGIWIDATIFLSNDIPPEFFESPFFSINTGDRTSVFASKGRWTGYFLAASYSHTVLFDFLQEIYTEYWRDHDIILCYFLMDYFFLIAYEKIIAVKKMIDEIPINNVNVKNLSLEINSPFDAEKWEKIQENTILHKLTWKKELLLKKEGKDTFYKIVLVNDKYNNQKNGMDTKK